MSDTLNILEGAREILLPRGAWITEDYFAIRKGSTFSTDSVTAENANCYCLVGAVNKAAYKLDPSLPIDSSYDMSGTPKIKKALMFLAEAAGQYDPKEDDEHIHLINFEGRVIDWNDSRRRKSDVIKAIDKAISMAKERETEDATDPS